MKSLSESILECSQLLPEGGVLAPKEFLHLGSRTAVDQAFSRLARSGRLMRVTRGIYVAPIIGRFGKRAPATEKVISALASKSHEVFAASGARAANALGLTRQVPVRDVFLSTGRPRTLQLGQVEVKIEHAQQWQFVLGATVAGEAVRALAWLGPPQASRAIAKLHKCMPNDEWQTLELARNLLPAWMAEAIGREAALEDPEREVVIQLHSVILNSNTKADEKPERRNEGQARAQPPLRKVKIQDLDY